MDSISAAELTEIVILLSNAMEAQFQYWLSITFAVIGACFIAKEQLTKKLRTIVIILYSLASILLTLKYIDLAASLVEYMTSLTATGIEWGFSGYPRFLTGIIRLILVVFGTSTAIWFLKYYSKNIEKNT